VGAENEWTNIEIVKNLLDILSKPYSLIKYVKDRPGHDRRYAIDNTKIKNGLGYTVKKDFRTGLEETVRWYLENDAWWQRIKTGEYLTYYEKMYGNR
jgi:dTDP-glucose 4,6-dehydratase